jgi:hypothetical protein
LADPRIGTLTVGGLDLARRRDFSALVTLEIAAERAVVTRALRLPQAAYREQLALINPLISDLDRLAYDAGGVGDAVGEGLPTTAFPIVIVAGNCPPDLKSRRWRIGKIPLIQNVLVIASHGRLVVPMEMSGAGMLRQELEHFTMLPTRTGARLVARGRAHDDLVLALALAVLAARLRAKRGAEEGR